MILDSMTVSVDFNGIVVFAWPALAAQFGGHIASGRNILKEFTETDLGDTVMDVGAVVPIVNLDDGGYLVRFLDAPAEPSPRRQVVFSDAGYALRVEGALYVADAAVFWDWEESLGWQKVAVPPGAYAVTVEGVRHLDAAGAIESTGYDLILQRVETLPERTAQTRADSRV